MNKHYSLTDFITLILNHKNQIIKRETEKGSLSHYDILEVLIRSEDKTAKTFTYVLGSMKGSQNDQYNVLMNKMSNRGHKFITAELEYRRDFPCIDIQESLWLLNIGSHRSRNSNYSYPDYDKYHQKQFISGSATKFHIKWEMLENIPIGFS